MYGLDEECDLITTIANLTEQMFNSKDCLGEGELTLCDGCGTVVEAWKMQGVRIDQIRYDDYSYAECFDIIMQVQFDNAEYTNYTKREE